MPDATWQRMQQMDRSNFDQWWNNLQSAYGELAPGGSNAARLGIIRDMAGGNSGKEMEAIMDYLLGASNANSYVNPNYRQFLKQYANEMMPLMYQLTAWGEPSSGGTGDIQGKAEWIKNFFTPGGAGWGGGYGYGGWSPDVWRGVAERTAQQAGPGGQWEEMFKNINAAEMAPYHEAFIRGATGSGLGQNAMLRYLQTQYENAANQWQFLPWYQFLTGLEPTLRGV